jgi:drug/metabolite transporter (DMT)-like permease
MLISGFAFALMAANVKLAGDIPVFEKVLFRNLVSLIAAFIIIMFRHRNMFGKRTNSKFLLLRSLLGLTGVALYFYSIGGMNLADSSMLNKFSPFFVTLFAVIFLKEKITTVKIISLIIAFTAVMLIIKHFLLEILTEHNLQILVPIQKNHQFRF